MSDARSRLIQICKNVGMTKKEAIVLVNTATSSRWVPISERPAPESTPGNKVLMYGPGGIATHWYQVPAPPSPDRGVKAI